MEPCPICGRAPNFHEAGLFYCSRDCIVVQYALVATTLTKQEQEIVAIEWRKNANNYLRPRK